MGEAIDKLGRVMDSILGATYYRSLHIVGAPFNVREVAAFAQEHEQGDGELGGTVEQRWSGLFIEVYAWEDIQMGENLPMTMFFYGLRRGPQTVFMRRRWYLGNFDRDTIKATLDPLGLVTDGTLTPETGDNPPEALKPLQPR